MQYEIYLNRAKYGICAATCFFTAVFVMYRGNALENPGSFIVPLMCALTALAVGATGLSLLLKALPKPE